MHLCEDIGFAGVSASIEAGSGLAHEHLHTRLADAFCPVMFAPVQTCSPRLHWSLRLVQPMRIVKTSVQHLHQTLVRHMQGPCGPRLM